MRRSLAIGGTFTRRDIEALLDTCERLLAQQDEMVRILGDLEPAWSDARAALNRLHYLCNRRHEYARRSGSHTSSSRHGDRVWWVFDWPAFDASSTPAPNAPSQAGVSCSARSFRLAGRVLAPGEGLNGRQHCGESKESSFAASRTATFAGSATWRFVGDVDAANLRPGGST